MHNQSLSAIPKFVIRVVILSFLVQVALIGLLHQYRTRPIENHFAFGWEMGRVARSIAQGQGFSNPYDANTGPTAWEPPIYPYLMGGVFKLFGIFSYASAWTLLIINSLFASLTTIPIFLIAARSFDGRVARWSLYGWALNPYIWYWSIHWIWDTTLTPFLLALIFLITLQLESWPGLRGWIIFGALWGVGALANPSMLAFLPFCGLWIWHRRFKNSLPSISGVIISSAVFFVALSPWLIRNYDVFGRFVFIRDDFGLQFRLGNSKGAEGMLMAYLQPNLNKLELEEFQRLGELEYGEECKRIAFEWIRQHPKQFAIVSLRRFFYYWNGVPKPTDSRAPWDFRNSLFLAWSVLSIWGAMRALRQRVRGAWLFAGLLLSYPTTYYFVFPHARYRHPIEPELIILAVYVIFQTSNSSRKREPQVASRLTTSKLDLL